MSNINIRVDDELKRRAEYIFSELGLNMSTATTAFLKQVVRVGGIPFELRIDPFESEENQKHLRAAAARLDEGKGIERSLYDL